MARRGVGVSLCSALHFQLFSLETLKKASASLRRSLLMMVVLSWLFVQTSLGQVATGTPPFGSFGGGPFDTINLGNLNVHFVIPVVHKAGRGMPFTYDLSYDSSVWDPSGGTWAPVANWGWRGVTEAASGYVTYATGTHTCADKTPGKWWKNWVYRDPAGIAHSYPFNFNVCSGEDLFGTATTTDGSGYTMYASAVGSSGQPTATVYPVGGDTIDPPMQDPAQPGTVYDRNGNYFISAVNSGTTTFTDTLGTNILRVSGTNPVQYQFLNPAGGYSAVKMNYSSYSIKTEFKCPNVTDVSLGSVPLVSSIVLPDQTSYTITYEKYSDGFYTGRIASITLPTGGKNATSCNMAFPTSLSLPLSLSASMTWDCNGGVMKSVTDPNSNPASLTYTDPNFWRPTASTD